MVKPRSSVPGQLASGGQVSEGRDGWRRYSKPGRLVSLYRRFPATISLAAPYVLLILPPAIIFGNPGLGFLVSVGFIAVAGTVVPELLRPPPRASSEAPVAIEDHAGWLMRVSVTALAISSVVHVIAAAGGKGSVAAQVGIAQASSGIFDSLDSLTSGWMFVGVGTLVAAYLGRQCSRRVFFIVLAIPALAKLAAVVLTQMTAPLFEYLTFLAMFLLFFGLVPARAIMAGILAALLIWPTFYALRNEGRVADGLRVDTTVSAQDRLRFDLQFARAREVEMPVEVQLSGILQNPTPFDIVRYGTIPRFLDPERDKVATAYVLNVALGGSDTSAYTFGPVNDTFVLEGPVYLFVYYALVAILVNVVWKRGLGLTPMRIVLLALVMGGPLGWFATFPDANIAMMQHLVSSLPIFLVLSLTRAQGRAAHDSSRPQLERGRAIQARRRSLSGPRSSRRV